jgi:hypothetical protein
MSATTRKEKQHLLNLQTAKKMQKELMEEKRARLMKKMREEINDGWKALRNKNLTPKQRKALEESTKRQLEDTVAALEKQVIKVNAALAEEADAETKARLAKLEANAKRQAQLAVVEAERAQLAEAEDSDAEGSDAEDFDQEETLQVTEADLEVAKANLQDAEADFEDAKANLEDAIETQELLKEKRQFLFTVMAPVLLALGFIMQIGPVKGPFGTDFHRVSGIIPSTPGPPLMKPPPSIEDAHTHLGRTLTDTSAHSGRTHTDKGAHSQHSDSDSGTQATIKRGKLELRF